MAKLRVDEVGSIGLVRDSEPWKVPASAWTDLRNAYCIDGTVGVFSSEKLIPLDLGTEPLRAVFLYPFGLNEYYFVCTSERVYILQGDTLVDITPDSFIFAYDENKGWEWLLFNGIIILNNGVNEPHYWPFPTQSEPFPKLKPMSSVSADWEENQSCLSLKAFNNALFAANISNDSGHFPYLVKFSDFAEAGALPTEWDAKPSNSAGDFLLTETLDPIVDAQVFKDSLILFKERSVHGIRFVGGNSVYQRYMINSSAGLLARGCLAATDNFLVALTNDDVIVTRGAEFETVIDQRLRRDLFGTIDSEMYKQSYVQHDPANKSVWFLLPYMGKKGSVAYIWNYNNNTWSLREFCGLVSAISSFPLLRAALLWSEQEMTWEANSERWEKPFLGEAAERLVFGHLTQCELGNPISSIALATGFDDGDPSTKLTAVLERKWIPFPRGDILDWDSVKYITEIIPKFRTGQVEWEKGVKIYIGSQMYQDDPIQWKLVGTFFPNTRRKKLGTRVSGRFISIRFEVPPEHQWQLTGYDIEYKLPSRR